MTQIGKYKNGNYQVVIYEDGTKIRENDLDFFAPEFPESIDLKITNMCDLGCPMCHEDSKPDGAHSDILHLPFLDSIHPYTEIAIGGGNPLAHPDIIPFLRLLRERNLIANLTVNQRHFMKNVPLLEDLDRQGFIHGLGVSYTPGAGDDEEFIRAFLRFRNSVLHVINGVHTVDQLARLRHLKLKVLILGYKEFRRGKNLYEAIGTEIEQKKTDLYDALPEIVDKRWFSAVSFDNLAIRQLDVKRLLSQEEWDEFYMGDDGRDGAFTSASMYIDAVKMEFARNSCSETRFPVGNDVTEMYQFLKEAA